MAVWIHAIGRNGLITDRNLQTKNYLDILNNIPLDEVKILGSIVESKSSTNPIDSIRQHYTSNRASIENQFKSMTKNEYKAYLNSMNLPFIEIDKIVDHFIADGEKRELEKESHFNFAYDQFKNGKAISKWELADNGFFVNRLCYFDTYGGVRINFLNDLVYITGPFSVFSIYTCFQKTISTESREYYHSYFKKILQAFKSDIILYAHEWSGLEDEEDKGFNFAKLKEQSKWDISSSNSIHTMEAFYYERI